MKKYTHVSYKDIRDGINTFEKYCQELDNGEPDRCSEVWQVAESMAIQLQAIANRAKRLEKEFNR
jgi:hypothetical protein